jgi:hypothetical protein
MRSTSAIFLVIALSCLGNAKSIPPEITAIAILSFSDVVKGSEWLGET